MRVIRAQIAASKRPQTSAVRVTWRRQRRKKKKKKKKKHLLRAWHPNNEGKSGGGGGRRGERKGGGRREEKKRMRLEKRGKKRWKDLSWSAASRLSVTGKAHLRSPTLKMADVEAD